jgi:hypothetical protein
MSNFYRVKDLPGLQGLVIESTTVIDGPCYKQMAAVETIINPNAIIGDRVVRYPIPVGALAIDRSYLTEVSDPLKEFTTQNPFGEFLFEGHYKRGLLEVAYSVYDNSFSVTIFEKNEKGVQKTIYSQNYFSNAKAARELVEAVFAKGEFEDLVFMLRELKEEESV